MDADHDDLVFGCGVEDQVWQGADARDSFLEKLGHAAIMHPIRAGQKGNRRRRGPAEPIPHGPEPAFRSITYIMRIARAGAGLKCPTWAKQEWRTPPSPSPASLTDRWHHDGMADTLKIAPALQARVDAIAARSRRSPAEVVANALEHGHSLDWQERFLDKVAAGIAAADAGHFAGPADVARVLNKYRPT
ncbi:hypothetical protein ABZT49_02230 [Methylobacterium sp. EM32]|uniref:CopG family ribbon-helix-helix protein n=1 Tax=Methylobacterium sp. EM32 TaxID=3163481 RepID=UPI0033B8B4A0